MFTLAYRLKTLQQIRFYNEQIDEKKSEWYLSFRCKFSEESTARIISNEVTIPKKERDQIDFNERVYIINLILQTILQNEDLGKIQLIPGNIILHQTTPSEYTHVEFKNNSENINPSTESLGILIYDIIGPYINTFDQEFVTDINRLLANTSDDWEDIKLCLI